MATAALLALTAASAAMSVMGGIRAGQSAKMEAKQFKRIGEIEAAEHRRETKRLTAAQQVGFAKGGVGTTVGTPLDVLGDTVARRELEALRIQFGRRSQAGSVRQQGRMAELQGATQGFSTILGTAGSLYALGDG